ncbi:hypothetical protein ACJRO7_009875 [Eucalyptus globulus]|uniref:Uncharacterized protein n=1 Tax=Eucalyptus globulus TaxID=34317 RepID=A0ABD3LF20_EUCGL
MSTAFKFENEIVQRSEQAEFVEFHPTEPWILVSLHSETTTKKTFKVVESPVRSAKFIPSKHWVIVASDDAFISVYNYSTMEKIKEFQVLKDYIGCMALDDAVIKLWDREKDWMRTQTFEGHPHCLMRVAFDPQDPNAFASASLDGTIKIWNVHSSAPKFTLDAHEKGLKLVDYFSTPDMLYLLSGLNDYTAKVWDDKGRKCVQTLQGYEHNVTAVCVHPDLPIAIPGSEEETLRMECKWLWVCIVGVCTVIACSRMQLQLKHALKFSHGRIWNIAHQKGSFACNEGIAVVELEP